MKKIVFIAALAALLSQITGCGQDQNIIDDSNPNNLLNRLNKTLFERTAPDGKHYGLDELDILYWYRTTNLLAGASYQQVTNVLDEFINSHGEKLIQDPLKKALLQRDLWALFDWAADGMKMNYLAERKELLKRLAVAIQRLELTKKEIALLPDNYVLAERNCLPDLPTGLFYTNGVWIRVSVKNAERLVPAHDFAFGGCSAFTVWFRDADGHKAGIDYLKQLGATKLKLVPATSSFSHTQMELSPDLPQFPTNSQWALARRMCVIDTDGKIQPTHVVESIQLRTYLGFGRPDYVTITNRNGYVVGVPAPPQRFNEFRMTRPDAKLISIAADETDFTGNNHFFSQGVDAFEPSRRVTNYLAWATNYDSRVWQNRVLGTCIECHTAPGIYSVNSFTRLLSGPLPTEMTQLVESDGKREEEQMIYLKKKQSDWMLLQDLWMQKN